MRRKSLENVIEEIELTGAKYLGGEYKNTSSTLTLQCSCGNEFRRTLDNFRRSSTCYECNKLVKEKNPRWNSQLTDEERFKQRDYKEYLDWRKSVYERDLHTCQSCLDRGVKLNAHHIEAFSENPQLRTDIGNGITLCVSCHKEYHKAFGITGANNTTFSDFMFGEYAASKEPPICYEERDDLAYFKF